MPGMTKSDPNTAATTAQSAPRQVAGAARRIDHIVIHCSATYNGQPLGNGTAQSAARVIDRWHAARGFCRAPAACQRYNPTLPSIGYHFVIDIDGRCDMGRAQSEVGAHAAGNNATSIGICMVGGLEAVGRYTRAQWETLRDLVESLLTQHPNAELVGHRDLSPDANHDGVIDRRDWLKTCPGFDVQRWASFGMVPAAEHVYPVEAAHA